MEKSHGGGIYKMIVFCGFQWFPDRMFACRHTEILDSTWLFDKCCSPRVRLMRHRLCHILTDICYGESDPYNRLIANAYIYTN